MQTALPRTRREGVALILALVIMAILTILLSVITMQIVTQRKVLHQRHRQLQAQSLARSGLELALARLLEKPDTFQEKALTLWPDAIVRIEVEKEKDIYNIRIDAELGPKEERALLRQVSGRFRRMESGGMIRLQSVEAEK